MQEGARVALVDRAGDRAQEVARRIGENTLAVAADVSRERDVVAAVEQILAAFGRIDLLHNHAGLLNPQDASILHITEAAIDETLAADEAIMADMRQAYLVDSLGQPEDVADSVVFLLSSRARYVTGATLLVDGGHTVR